MVAILNENDMQKNDSTRKNAQTWMKVLHNWMQFIDIKQEKRRFHVQFGIKLYSWCFWSLQTGFPLTFLNFKNVSRRTCWFWFVWDGRWISHAITVQFELWLQVVLKFKCNFWEKVVQDADFFGHVPESPEGRGSCGLFYDLSSKVRSLEHSFP